MDVGCSLKLFVDSTMKPQYNLASPTLQLSKNSPPLTQVLKCKGAPICPSTAHQGAKTLCIHMVWMWDAIWSCLLPQPWNHNTIWHRPYLKLPKIHPHLHKYNSVRVHPYVHPQHIKVLKHFLYIWYGCRLPSETVCYLNHDTTTTFTLTHTPIFHKFTPTCTGITM